MYHIPGESKAGFVGCGVNDVDSVGCGVNNVDAVAGVFSWCEAG